MHVKILKITATSRFLTALECTKFVFGRPLFCRPPALLLVYVSGDGNCFFNALLVALYGHQSFTTEMCLWCCIYYALHLAVLGDAQFFHAAVLSLAENLTAISEDGGWSSARTFIAAANVLSQSTCQ